MLGEGNAAARRPQPAAEARGGREAGRQRFIYLTLAVPGDWTVQQGHDLSDRLERDITRELDDTTVFTHIETHEPSDPNRPILGEPC